MVVVGLVVLVVLVVVGLLLSLVVVAFITRDNVVVVDVVDDVARPIVLVVLAVNCALASASSATTAHGNAKIIFSEKTPGDHSAHREIAKSKSQTETLKTQISNLISQTKTKQFSVQDSRLRATTKVQSTTLF
jgi:hypothetical protein